MTESSLDKKLKFSVKDVIYILVIVISLAGNYYNSKYERESIKKDVAVNTDKIAENSSVVKDMNLIQYRLKNIEKLLEKLTE